MFITVNVTGSAFKIAAFVINLDASVERLNAVNTAAGKLKLPLTRVPGILGRDVDLSKTPEVDVKGYELRHGRRINLSEVGCYLSHLKAIRTFLDSDADFGIILEDDAGLPNNYLSIIEDLIVMKSLWDLVKLSSFHSGTPVSIKAIPSGGSLAIPLSRHMNANNVIYSRHAAQVMLNRLSPMQLPFDHALERAWFFGLRLRIIDPSPCPADTGHASTIADSKRYHLVWFRRLPCFGFRLVTELSRLCYGLGHALRFKLTGF